ncbi:hypothetical protein [Methylocapsa sp. S129]|uniref:hypothetical protein n=1 Tax=Methylocapsa sp. S129 TaxID=1641869 RepID=UPI00131DCB42|nr:hypothetical protein [Methylocapsa sp. S129]
MRGLNGKNAEQADKVTAYAQEHEVNLRAVELDVQSDASALSAIAATVAEHGPYSKKIRTVRLGIERRRLKRSRLGFRQDYGKRRR